MLEFDEPALTADRADLLEQAAEHIERRTTELGVADADVVSADAAMIRGMAEDRVELGGFPDVYAISDDKLVRQSLPVPARNAEISRDFRYFLASFPVLLWPKRNWGFNRLEMQVVFNPDEAVAKARPKALAIFPERKFETLFKADQYIDVGVEENLAFSAKAAVPQVATPVASAAAKAGVGVSAEGGFSFVVGPFSYKISRARIDHSAAGLEQVWWRFDGSGFFEENPPHMMVILKVPKIAQRVDVTARLVAYRFFNLGSSGLRQAIADMPKAIRTFMQNGAPLSDRKLYEDVAGAL